VIGLILVDIAKKNTKNTFSEKVATILVERQIRRKFQNNWRQSFCKWVTKSMYRRSIVCRIKTLTTISNLFVTSDKYHANFLIFQRQKFCK